MRPKSGAQGEPSTAGGHSCIAVLRRGPCAEAAKSFLEYLTGFSGGSGHARMTAERSCVRPLPISCCRRLTFLSPPAECCSSSSWRPSSGVRRSVRTPDPVRGTVIGKDDPNAIECDCTCDDRRRAPAMKPSSRLPRSRPGHRHRISARVGRHRALQQSIGDGTGSAQLDLGNWNGHPTLLVSASSTSSWRNRTSLTRSVHGAFQPRLTRTPTRDRRGARAAPTPIRVHTLTPGSPR